MPTVAFQGELGAFSEEAVHRFFREGADPVPRRTFAEVGQAVLGGEVEYGLLPVENSLAGTVVGSYDVLAASELTVVGEVVTAIHHCLLAAPGTALEAVTQVISHPVALAQCQRFLQDHPSIEATAFYDTAGAAKEVADSRRASQAAIAGRHAADRYGLEILAADIEDRSDNQTRFLVVTRSGGSAPAEGIGASAPGARKTAILLDTGNAPGALVHALLPFAERGINLSKIESRPGVQPWTYRFFIEVEADSGDPEVERALTEARAHASRLHLLGTFPRWGERTE